MNFIDICAGIGGIRHGLELAGHKCVGFCEIDNYAVRSYRAIYDTEGEWYANDITKLGPEDVPYADLWTFGSPCQNISVAGRRVGIRGERSGIYFNIIDLIKGKEESAKPEWILMENVKNLLSVNAGWDFSDVLIEMDEAGYDVQWQVLNSKAFGVPQNRERCFIIGHLRSRGGREILPVREADGKNLVRLIGGSQGQRVYDINGVSCTINSQGGGMGARTGLYFIDMSNNNSKITENARCLTARDRGISNYPGERSGVLDVRPIINPGRETVRQNGRRMKDNGDDMFTLTAQDRHGVAISGIYTKSSERFQKKGIPNLSRCLKANIHDAGVTDGFRIRRLTPRECWRLQGFSDEQFDKARPITSDAQLYKQAGNAVTVNVAYAIGLRLKEAEMPI